MTSLQPLFDSQGNILNENRNLIVNTAESSEAQNQQGSTSNSGIMVDASDILNYNEQQGAVRQGQDFPSGNNRMVAEDGSHMITFTSSQLDRGDPLGNPPTPARRPAPRIIGSTNFSMEYDDDMKKYKFTSLHTDFFGFPLGGTKANPGSQSANSCFQFFRNQTSAGQGANARGRNDIGFYNSSQGGCCIVDLEPHDFWFGSLGFQSNLHILDQNFKQGTITSFNVNLNPNPPLTNTPCRIPTFRNLNLGETYTCGARSLATVQRSGAFIENGGNANDSRIAQQIGHYANQDSGGTANLSPPAYTFNYDIVANETFLNNVFTNGYYLIEISGLPNIYKGKTLNKNNVMGIVSRYYNTQNYTIGDESNSVIYQHNGESISINNLNVRILLPDGTLAPLQDDNTVFLKIRKADLQLLKKQKKNKNK